MTDNKNWKKTKTIYWSDELNDDFDEVLEKRPPVPENYRYERRGKIWSGFLYYVIAKPILGLYCIFHGVRFKNKKNLKELRHQGYFIYSNHVAISDVFKFQTIGVAKKRVNIIGYSDALSLKWIRPLLKAIGYLPIPEDIHLIKKLNDAIGKLVNHKEIVLIYPEAHIWPYYTKIRNFKSVSFTYPAEFNKPILPAVTVWLGKPNRKPKQIVVYGKPIYPNPDLSVRENRDYLHEQCLLQMKDISSRYNQVEYIKYIKKED